MSQSPHSSADAGPSSSPFAGTDDTVYSPEAVRHNVAATTESSSKAAGKKPVREVEVVAIEIEINGIRYKGLNPLPHDLGRFVNELTPDDKNFISRYLLVKKTPDGIKAGHDHEMELFCVQFQMKLYQVFVLCVPVYCGGVHLRFDDLHDSCEAKYLLEMRNYEMDFIDNYDFAIAKAQDTMSIDEFEGQIGIQIAVQPVVKSVNQKIMPIFNTDDLIWLHLVVELVMSIFGTVRTYVHTATDEKKLVFTFRVEFHSVDAAGRAVASLAQDSLWGMSDDDVWQWMTQNPYGWNGPRSANSPHRTKQRIDDRGRLIGWRHQPQIDPKMLMNHPCDHHNRVIRSKILDGTDVRTTIMLRNIPNKLDWMSLKALLDQVCFGTYDFVYLRIDFKTGHNVGYAFINFADIGGMIAMLDKVEFHSWVGYRSAKNAEISYATIQGREALVAKFRNSSVMQETPFCRPRLFLTYGEAVATRQLRQAGMEQVFPSPDNLSKLQRSMDSARSVGLFPPTGITLTPEQRNRASAYDRGTPRDIVHHAIFPPYDANFEGATAGDQAMLSAQLAMYGRPIALINRPVAPMVAGPPHAVPPPFIPEDQKRECEHWFARMYGLCTNGITTFDWIPFAFKADYFEENPVTEPPPVDVGVIGGPVPSQQAHLKNQGYNQGSGGGRHGRGSDSTPARNYGNGSSQAGPSGNRGSPRDQRGSPLIY